VSDIDANLKSFYNNEMGDRARRTLGDEREHRVRAFTDHLHARGAKELLEVGCGAGRDGLILSESGCNYTGIDLSSAAVQTCRDLGLHAVEAAATSLPFVDNTFDAAWSMSTLMHLPGDGLDQAIRELRRVVRPGAVVEIGVWGHTTNREWTSPDGRYFNHRSDELLQHTLRDLGQVVAFDTWDWFDDGGHYQRARVIAQ
jgi:SAM-dependent methyltransferase